MSTTNEDLKKLVEEDGEDSKESLKKCVIKLLQEVGVENMAENSVEDAKRIGKKRKETCSCNTERS